MKIVSGSKANEIFNAIERKNYCPFGNLKKPEGDVHPEDVTRQDDPAGPRCDQEFDGSLDSFVLITFNYNFSFAGFSQTRRWARNIQPRRSIDGGYEPLPCILSKHLLYVHDEVDFCCIVAGYRQLQRGVAILVLHIEVCIRAVEKKFENSRLLQLQDPSGLLQETSAVFFILLEDTAGHLKNPRPHPTVTELWRELSYYHVQSYKFKNLQLSVLWQ